MNDQEITRHDVELERDTFMRDMLHHLTGALEDIIGLGEASGYGKKVIGRPSLCMTSSTVFGTITADSLGYAKVSLDETIAGAAPGCRITIDLKENDEPEGDDGKEYFRV